MSYFLTKLMRGVQLIYVAMLCKKGQNKTQAKPIGKKDLFMMGLFEAAHGRGRLKYPLPKICHTYLRMMKLSTVIPYLEQIQTIFE